MAAATDEAQLKQTFAAELHSIKSDLQAIKSKFYDRQAARNKLHDAQAALQALGPAADPSNPLEAQALQELQQLVAAELLDPACTLPIPADALHRKVRGLWKKVCVRYDLQMCANQ
jgi:DNA repair exonuclease SbcCD ATPase subunit